MANVAKIAMGVMVRCRRREREAVVMADPGSSRNSSNYEVNVPFTNTRAISRHLHLCVILR